MTDAEVERVVREQYPMFQVDRIVRRTTPGAADTSVYAVLENRTVRGFRCVLDAVAVRDYGDAGWYTDETGEILISGSARAKAFMRAWVAAHPGSVVLSMDSGTGDQPGATIVIDYAESVSAFTTAQLGGTKAAWRWDAAAGGWEPVF
jgi:hypothetical protein